MALNLLNLKSPIKITDEREVHIWMIDFKSSLFAQEHFDYSILSNEEVMRAKNFKLDQHKVQFLTSHVYLRLILSRYLHCSPKTICYGVEEYGKPFLMGQNESYKIYFNMSHSEGAVLYAITLNAQIGADIELIKDNLDIYELLDNVFTAHEKSLFKNINAEKKYKVFYNVWTRKEAYLKAIGTGLNFPLNKLEVSVLPDAPAKLISVNGDEKFAIPWFLYSLDLTKYSAAIAIKREKNIIRFMSHLE